MQTLEQEVQEEHPKIALVGPPRVGKSSRVDAIESLTDLGIERGKKYKYRPGGQWKDDGSKKDSIPVRNAKKLQKLRSSGNVVFEYSSVDTVHLVDKTDAKRTDKPLMYISDTYNGVQAYNIHFPNLVTYFLYTTPQIIEERLKRANIPRSQIRARLSFFMQELSLFMQHAAEFHFPIFTRQREFYPPAVSQQDIEKLNEGEIYKDAQRMLVLLGQYKNYWKQGMTVPQFHEAYVKDQIRNLLEIEESDLEARIKTSGLMDYFKNPLVLDLNRELREYKGNVPAQLAQKGGRLRVMGYFKGNGRYAVFLEGLVEPWNPGDSRPEEIVLDLIGDRIGQPAIREQLSGRGFENFSNLGMLHVKNALIRDGARYSLGDPIPMISAHSSLVIVFLYKNGKQAEPRSLNLQEVEQRYGWVPPFHNGQQLVSNL